MSMYERLGVSANIVTVAALPNEAGALSVAAGKGIYIVPGEWIKSVTDVDNIVAVHLSDEDAYIHVHVVSRRNETSKCVHDFIATLQKVLG